ncbi:MAG: C-type lectin domain-containing protein, partial [Dorea sp.]
YKGKQAGVLDGLTVRTHRYLDLEEIDLRMLNAEIIVVDEDTGEKIKNADVKYVINTNFTSEQTDQNGKISLKDMVVADEGKVSANYEFDIFAEGYSSKNCVITVNDGDSKVVKLKKAEIRIPDGAVKFREHSYYLYEAGTVSTYEEALQFCTERGGHLATISSQAENDFVYAYITQMDCWSAYFGLSDADEEETWKWCNGERVSYTNWHGNEPNGENPNEDYGQFYYKYKDGTWNDGDFGRQTVNDITAFICEWDIINVY